MNKKTVRGDSLHAAGSALTLDQLCAFLGTTRQGLVAVAYRSKAGRCSDSDMRVIAKVWAKLRTKKWSHLSDEYKAVVGEGARQAVAEINPFLRHAPNDEAELQNPTKPSPRPEP